VNTNKFILAFAIQVKSVLTLVAQKQPPSEVIRICPCLLTVPRILWLVLKLPSFRTA